MRVGGVRVVEAVYRLSLSLFQMCHQGKCHTSLSLESRIYDFDISSYSYICFAKRHQFVVTLYSCIKMCNT